jgi:hypothetical protein
LVHEVESCLNENLGPYKKNHQTFQCFDGVDGKAAESRGTKLRLGKWMIVMMGFGFFGIVMGV